MFFDGIGIDFEKKLVLEKVSVSVSKFFGIEKKYRYRFRKFLVSEKVSVSVSEKIGIGKKFRIRFRSNFRFRHTLISSISSISASVIGIGKDICPYTSSQVISVFIH